IPKTPFRAKTPARPPLHPNPTPPPAMKAAKVNPSNAAETVPIVAAAVADAPKRLINLTELKQKNSVKLLELAEELGIQEGVARARKQDVIFNILRAH